MAKLTVNIMGSEKVILIDNSKNTLVVTRTKSGYSFESVNREDGNGILKAIFDVQKLVKATLMKPERSKDAYDKRFLKLFNSINSAEVTSFRALRGRLLKGEVTA